ncbi:hypothetical protein DDN39_12805 [Vibrio cholerae]|nr:hypothetical protein [Vibrio cholerae]EGR4361931.1 hypothetical protein [Vibrio cholerae]
MRAILGSQQRPADGCANFSRQICHSFAAYLQHQAVWVYPYLPYGFWDYFVGQLSMVRRFALS